MAQRRLDVTHILAAVLTAVVLVPYLLADDPRSLGTQDQSQVESSVEKRVLLEHYDANDSGLLDAEEREAWRRDRAKRPSGASRRWDRNGDGKIDAAEREAARKWLRGEGRATQAAAAPAPGPKRSSMERKRLRDQRNQELALRHDKNGDGKLDREECDALWTEYKTLLRAKRAEQEAASRAQTD